MTFDRTISYENLSINVKAKFIKSESIISKIIDLFKRWEGDVIIDQEILV